MGFVFKDVTIVAQIFLTLQNVAKLLTQDIILHYHKSTTDIWMIGLLIACVLIEKYINMQAINSNAGKYELICLKKIKGFILEIM